MSSLSSAENQQTNDSMSRATYFAQQQLLQQQHQAMQAQQQLQYQQQQLQMQYQQQKNLLNNNNSNNITNSISHNNNYNINNTYSAPSCVNNYSQLSNNIGAPQQFAAHNTNNISATLGHNPINNNSHQQYQHPSISAVFPSIYAEANFNTSTASNSSSSAQMSMPNHYSSVQRQIQQDWSNREYIEVVVSNIKKLTDFLNSFELSCRSKMAILDEKLTKLERQIDFVEAKVTKGDTLN